MSVQSSFGPEAPRRTFTPYVLLYVLAAVLAGGYLVFIGMKPDLVAAWKAGAPAGGDNAAIAETQRHVERALADIEPVKESLGQMQMEVATIKASVDEGAQRDRAIMEKMEAIERTAVEAHERATAVTAPKVAAAEPAKQKSIETGSIDKKAEAPKAAPPPVGVLLATGPSLDSLRLSWTILNDRQPEAVRSLNARYVVSGSGAKRTYGLVAGPLNTVADAKAICKDITAQGMACEVSQFRGNTF
ncbi:hypothetical protein [Hyphomicrobium sp. D-2]|uniref:hypothetical protein n=1 Tax=Hyphomicrobium sp. D-2 TaxID=3041621 RepID=UPI002458DEE6|nr:hypothetical protein [Hyphomicrobium sp. D-2]MDH4981725.1 hypothetical protein [Hyphomicrobium sp. D-2]